MKQIPDFLKEYETALQKYRQRSVEIFATALNDGETTDIKSSKFLGTPYLPVGTDYPKDKDGKYERNLCNYQLIGTGRFFTFSKLY